MALETEYKNPEVVLTIAASDQQLDYVRYIKCTGLIMIAIFIAFFSGTESLLLSVSVVVFLIALIILILNRPEITMDSIKKTIRVNGKRDGSQTAQFAPNMVDKIRVRTRTAKASRWSKKSTPTGLPGKPGKRHLDTWYYSQLFLKNPKGKRKSSKTRIVETFELEDIVEAHYMAQLISSFTDAKAFDVQGKVLPSTKSHIPTKYLKHPD